MSEPRKYKYIPEKYPERPEIKDLDKDKIVKMLLSAFADEILAYYSYLMMAYAIRGHISKELEETILEIGKDELEDHAKKLADRLQDFDVDPPDFRDLWQLSRCRYPDLPDDPHDIDSWLLAGVKAEICALQHYREIYEYVSPKDPVTEEVVEEIMEDEAKHETIFRMLLSKEGLKKLEEAK
uniref:DNA protection during starvation protein n=2 Tax=Ignisphaera aggregans TaxID=334771 RepID=A0A7C5TJ14_9CREN